MELWSHTELDTNPSSITNFCVTLGVFLISLSLCILIYKTSLFGVVVRLKQGEYVKILPGNCDFKGVQYMEMYVLLNSLI